MAKKPTLKLMMDKAQQELTAEQERIARAVIADMRQASLEFIRETMATAQSSGKKPHLQAVMLNVGESQYPAVMIAGEGLNPYYFPGKSYPVPQLGTSDKGYNPVSGARVEIKG